MPDFMLKPLNDGLVVEPLPLPESGVIVLPDSAKTGPPRRGKILAVGPGKLVKTKSGGYLREKMECKVGQVVQFGEYSIDVEWNGLLRIREGDVLVVES